MSPALQKKNALSENLQMQLDEPKYVGIILYVLLCRQVSKVT